MVEFCNTTHHVFNDISSEEYREYIFPNGEVTRIENPLKIHITFSGHRIFDQEGISHYVPKGWMHLRWKAREGRPHFTI